MDKQKLVNAAKAAGYEAEYGVKTHTGIQQALYKDNRFISRLSSWNPTQGQDFINLIADAKINIWWDNAKEYCWATVRHINSEGHPYTISSYYQKISDHPSPTDAMIAAVLECAIKKGEAINEQEKGDG